MGRKTGAARDEALLRAAICAAGRRLGARGLISAAEGNLSLRLAGDRLLATPTGRRKDELDPGDLANVPLDPASGPAATGPRPSSDIAIHRAIYRARPDVVAIVHAHLPVSMALTLAGEVPDPAALPETAHFLPVLPFVPFGTMGSDELAGRIAAAFTPPGPPLPRAVLLERHGAVAVGSVPPGTTDVPSAADGLGQALTEAVDRLELVEVLCRAWCDAILVRAARGRRGPITPAGR
ncbi:MAG: Ribulose-5-phosphate 4-epimerase-related epimerase and aldolase [Chloroflexi bacterium]|nr:Ribulose-5-phosphate 4-epimerase-related epimerase and aldolase [Chloroflexota bacterium]